MTITHLAVPTDPDVVRAASAAVGAAGRAEVVLRYLAGRDELEAAVALTSDIWRRVGGEMVTTELLRAFVKSGNYVGGAYDGDELVGVGIAFHSSPAQRTVHSHIVAVTPAMKGRSVGFALKVHQRAWALSQGISVIEWTFDPLVARNAYFNIGKLAAFPVDYLTNFYGTMPDAINGQDETDRLLTRWMLLDPQVVVAVESGRAVPADSTLRGRTVVPVPADIEAMRRADPAAARRWRTRVRDRLDTALKEGGKIVGFDRFQGYIVQTHEQNAPLEREDT
ncbi:GNAT family N-acetyltransferase [Lacisediminihabitans sp. FW035]